MAKYAVLVTETIVNVNTFTVEAPNEEEAIKQAIAEAKGPGIDLVELSDDYHGEVLRQIVGAGPPPQDPHAKKTVAIKKLEVTPTDLELVKENRLCCVSRRGDRHANDCPNARQCTCTAGRHAGCPVPGHDDGDR